MFKGVLCCTLLLALCLNLLHHSWAIEPQKTCRALALGSGGDRGSFEIGVLKYLVEKRPSEETQYRVVTGNSAGAINAVAFSQFPIGEEAKALQYLLNEWTSIQSDMIYQNWKPFGIVQGFFLKTSLFDSSPLESYLAKHLNWTLLQKTDRFWKIGATDLSTFSYREFSSENHLNFDQVVTAVRASSAIPGIFSAVNIQDSLYVDGGVRYMTPITDAIEKCKNMTVSGGQVVIDVLLAINSIPFPKMFDFHTTPFILLETMYGSIMDIVLRDLESARLAYKDDPSVEIRAFIPNEWLPGYFIGFDHVQMKIMIQKGFETAKKFFEKI
ncbi:hypothetical protein C9374_005368 [Naegleria lovaniensis]|uniref:PNPLA domain-containing protein n=1 Tax=Naegleria lovaniensis TaxID=51637 RepID=A0AA88GMY6_NAELO|nr:uncharacterized protein C9374_005368 [Naegleria lovaniensis]KAG2382166.1 hypothetical protein C9374_005368 [Naegleria lovaniensis]